MKTLKKIGRFLFSMQFALGILCIFVIVCIVGSVIPQGEIAAVYEKAYPGWSGLILSCGFDDVFHSWWFVLLTLALCVNLLGCNLLHFPALMKKSRGALRRPPVSDNAVPALTGNPDKLFQEMGFHKAESRTVDGITYRCGIRNKIGLWGAWLTHLGILIIILGFSLGQIYTTKYTVYGVPGEECDIADTGYRLTIDDFNITLREDDTVEQYTASLTVTDLQTGESWSGESSVNHPWDIQGMRLYQNSTGWAADVVVFEGEKYLQQQVLCVGEYLTIQDQPDLLVAFRSFYPDYTVDADGMPATASDRMENPAYLYILYYKGEVLGMNVLKPDEKITVSDYTIIFSNPRYYTLIQIKTDPFTWLAGIGGVLLLIALFIAFYLRTEELWLRPNMDGSWTVCGRSRKGSLLFQQKLLEKVEKCNQEVSL